MKQCLIVLGFVLFFPAREFGFSPGWSTQSSNTSANLYGVSASDANTWVAVGDGGTILRSSDGGIVWSSMSSPVGDQLRAVSLRGTIGLAVGFAGQVLRTMDAGLSWTKETRPTTKRLYSVSLGDSVAVITGEEGTILISTDSGMSWSPRTAGTASVLFGVSVFGRTAVGVGGQGAIVNSVNGGQGWGLQVMGQPQTLFFYGTSFVNTQTGWAVGSFQATGSIVLKTTQSGFGWTLGTHLVTFDALGLASGLYLSHLEVLDANQQRVFTATNRLMLLK